ncbi:hypothetical protein [Variovorax sp. EBFNA2]|uniref:hypothetical protein n=1 Tax=Variovorax sp. EBFNA2 TaxID=3342097 RepID=UPI0029BFDE30|nr:hypothetical protein [Variovorax boronicumulans]WPG35308.1 hypothetical protein RZE79_17630 [Variovorax boronicumulans]
MSEATTVAVRYIGRKPDYTDRLYKSGLTFTPRQERSIPATLAQRFLKHKDSFEQVEAAVVEPKGEKTTEAGTSTDPGQNGDDTDALLAEADKKEQDKKAAVAKLMDLKDQVNQMEKDAVQQFAREKYDQAIPKTLTLPNMRAKALELIDQFGAR